MTKAVSNMEICFSKEVLSLRENRTFFKKNKIKNGVKSQLLTDFTEFSPAPEYGLQALFIFFEAVAVTIE